MSALERLVSDRSRDGPRTTSAPVSHHVPEYPPQRATMLTMLAPAAPQLELMGPTRARHVFPPFRGEASSPPTLAAKEESGEGGLAPALLQPRLARGALPFNEVHCTQYYLDCRDHTCKRPDGAHSMGRGADLRPRTSYPECEHHVVQ